MRPDMRRALGLLVAWSLLLSGCDVGPPAGDAGLGEAPRPNLLLVTIDTLRADRLECYGGPEGVGRAICALAEPGVRYAWAFATAPFTAPSVASLLTSRYPSRHRVVQAAGSAVRPNDPSVAQVLRSSGYATAAVVSNPVLDRRRGFRQGFDFYDAEMTRPERNRPAREREAVATTDAALAWLADPPSSPWFLWVHYQDPHGPYDPPGAAPPRDPQGAQPLPVLENHSGQGGIPAYQVLEGVLAAETYASRYLDEIRHVDAAIGRLLDGIEARGARPHVLLTSDHGEAFGEDGFFFAHGHSVGLDQIRVPLLWRSAEPGSDHVVSAPVSLIDLAPTLLELAGVDPPEGFEGRPLPRRDADASEGRALFAEQRHRLAIVRGDSYFARDRKKDAVPWHPNRTARLTGSGPLPGYAPAPAPGAPDSLEAPLRAFERAGRAGPAGHRVEVTPEQRRRLRELGYAD